MARKKFYNVKVPEPTNEAKGSQWKIGLYIRLSREDGDKAVSDSVINQKKMLKYYVEDHSDLFDYEYFVDENVTGTNFDRPAFQAMVHKIKTREISLIMN